MLALLLGGGFVYLLLGDLKEALILLGFAIMSIVITVIQETRTERVLEALRDLTSPRALVIRDGERKRIAGREVARGDLVVVAEGDRVPADAVAVQARDLQADESLLTGESVPVRKIGHGIQRTTLAPAETICPLSIRAALVVRGSGLAAGRSDRATQRNRQDWPVAATPRNRAATAAAADCATGAAVALGGAAVSVLAVVLYGTLARRMARCRAGRHHHRHVHAAGRVSGRAHRLHGDGRVADLKGARAHPACRIDRNAGLGNGPVTDKTGTLTENRMTIAELRLPTEPHCSLPISQRKRFAARQFSELARVHGLLASAPEPFDPMEKAFHAFARETPGARENLPDPGWRLVQSYGLRPDLLAMMQLWHRPERRNFWSRARARPRRSPAFADLPNSKSARCGGRSMPWRRTGCACWASPQPRRRTAVFQRLRPNSPSAFSASSVLPIRFAKACRRRSAIAAPPASASS